MKLPNPFRRKKFTKNNPAPNNNPDLQYYELTAPRSIRDLWFTSSVSVDFDDFFGLDTLSHYYAKIQPQTSSSATR